MAPEIHLNRKYQGEKVDVFALGVILFNMLYNQKPFEAARADD
jgi:serine/threonine protein kinase